MTASACADTDRLLESLAQALAGLDPALIAAQYREQGELVVIERFLPPDVLEALLGALPALAPAVTRNYLPGHKQGGSVSRFALDRLAPVFGQLYRSEPLLAWMRGLSDRPELQHCPPRDPHTYALYYYTRPGDHIGWHFDTSYYHGQRYTLLLGLVDRSSCKLECVQWKGDPGRERTRSVTLSPGTLVFFNGDRCWHRVTPAQAGEERVALTFEYVTDPRMPAWRRLVSDMKDALGYFGFRQVFLGRN